MSSSSRDYQNANGCIIVSVVASTHTQPSFGVYRVNDDGRRELIRYTKRYDEADATAGRLRDESSDDEIAQGWNYLPLSSKMDVKLNEKRTRNKE